MAIKDYRDESRKRWGQDDQDGRSGQLNIDQIQLGAILRIADATEKMCVDRVKLESDLLFYKTIANNRQSEIESLRRSKSSYIGKFRQMKEALRIANIEIQRLKGDPTNA